MDSTIIAALIGLAGVILGAILKAVLPGSRVANWMTGKSPNHILLGKWQSSWGPLPNGPVKYSEALEITKQSGQRISGFITPNKMNSRISGRSKGNTTDTF